MRLRPLLAATAASALLTAGLISTAVQADRALPRGVSGPVVVWGDPSAGPAAVAPGDLTELAVDIATSDRATAVVTADGRLRVWGESAAAEVTQAPIGITDAVFVSLADGGGAVGHADGNITAWGSLPDNTVSPGQNHKAVFSVAGETGYDVRGGSLRPWGAEPDFPVPGDLTRDISDVSARPDHVLALTQTGTVTAWGDPAIPAFNTVPDFGDLKVTQVATGPGANGVVLTDGTIRIWGPDVPPGQPDLTGKKVISLDLGTNAGVVTEDGSVYTWGAEPAVAAVPASLQGQAVVKIAMGDKHAAVIVAYRALSTVRISGTPSVGQVLTSTPATYTVSPTTTTGQWYAGTRPIKGQTGPTLTVDDSLVSASISYHTTSTRGGVALLSESNAIGPVVRSGSTTTLTVAPARGVAGQTRTATATVTRPGGTPTGSVTFTVGTSSRVVALNRGKATWALPRLAAGKHPVTATYSGSPSAEASTAAPVNLTISKVSSKLRATARATAKRVRIAVNVKTDKAVSAAGKVIVKVAGRKARAEVDANGRALVTVKRVPRGTHTALVTYVGNGSVAGSKGSVRVRS